MSSQEKSAGNPQWRDMTLEELEMQYSPSKWSKRYAAEEIISAHVKVATDCSKNARHSVKHRSDVKYAEGPRAKLDVFGEDLPGESAVLVYIHGGYWQELHKDVSAYIVEPLYRQGVVTVVVGYDLAPQVSVEMIVNEAQAAVKWACQLAQGRGSNCVVLTGWSAGAHLVTQALSALPTTKESTENKKVTDITLYKDLIRGVVTFSGVFDLRPLVNTYVNEPLHLTESTAWTLSPMFGVSRLAKAWADLQLLVTVGQHDSPEFRRQSWEYSHECKTAGLKAEYMEIDQVDHFSIVEDLAKENFSLVKKVAAFIKACVKRQEKNISKYDNDS